MTENRLPEPSLLFLCVIVVVSGPVQELRWIHWSGPFADLEMQLRCGHIWLAARARDDLPALDLIATLHQKLFGMSIGGDVAIGMAHQNEIAITLELISA